ncbi:MAG TPA: nucleotide disphospho-sugar-binding domain-containing protein [Candidatus Saccharimonadales bacterium]|nr:nucleotide disphospho-sugar-binding domain-containing protein [Candidatus Saccharimonadales bacterium]
MTPDRRPRILFVSEAPSLAHVARPFVLAKTLDPERYDIHFASPGTPSTELVLADAPFTRWALETVPAATFLDRMKRGRPFWTVGDIDHYVDIDRDLIRRVQPDLIVADLRVSLSTSAALEGVPWAAMVNSYWSEWAFGWRHPVPETNLSSPYIPWLTQFAFERLLPFFIWEYVRPVNVVRRRHGLRPYGSRFSALYAGDSVLYVDPPGMVRMRPGLPSSHIFVGPAIWSAPAPLPPWWDDLAPNDPLIYVGLGSTGKLGALPTILSALRGTPYRLAVAVGGRELPAAVFRDVFVAPYLPGDLMARRAALVIGNGGSAGLYQSLNEGTPVRGIPENLDQHMTMAALAGLGASRSIRSDRLTSRAVRSAVDLMVSDPGYRAAAGRIAELFRANQTSVLFPRFIESVLPAGAVAPRTAGSAGAIAPRTAGSADATGSADSADVVGSAGSADATGSADSAGPMDGAGSDARG